MEVECSSKFLSLASGGCMALAWGIFGDAILLHSIHAVEPPISLAHWIPGIVAMIAFFLLITAPVHYFSEFMNMFSNRASCAHCWIFMTFLLFFLSMTMGVFLMEAMRSTANSQYAYLTMEALNVSAGYDDVAGEGYHLQVGLSVILHTVLVFGSAGLCLASRMTRINQSTG